MNTMVFDVMLGLVFIYLLFSLLCTSVNELISRMLKLRARNLREGIGELLGDPVLKGLAQEVYRHPLIQNLSHDRFSGMRRIITDVGDFGDTGKKGYAPGPVSNRRLPSYISSENFTMALLDILGKNGSDQETQGDAMRAVRKGIDSLDASSGAQKALTTLLDDAGDDTNRFKENIQNWFDDSMDRIAGWYTRRIQSVSLVVALFITLLFNVNTVEIVAELWNEPGARGMLAEQAAELCAAGTELEDCMAKFRQVQSSELPIPLGWGDGAPLTQIEHEAVQELGLIGWIITAIALSLGAPFWFGLLVKLKSIRTTGVRPQDRPRPERSKLPTEAAGKYSISDMS